MYSVECGMFVYTFDRLFSTSLWLMDNGTEGVYLVDNAAVRVGISSFVMVPGGAFWLAK